MIVLGLIVCWFEAFIKKKKKECMILALTESLYAVVSVAFFLFVFFTFELSPI